MLHCRVAVKVVPIDPGEVEQDRDRLQGAGNLQLSQLYGEHGVEMSPPRTLARTLSQGKPFIEKAVNPYVP